MTVVFTNDARERISIQPNPVPVPHVKPEIWQEEQADIADCAQLRFRHLYFDGVHIGYCHLDIHENIQVTTEETTPLPGFVFLQQGSCSVTSFEDRTTRHYTAGQHTVLKNPYATATTVFKKQHNMQLFLLSFLPERFQQLVQDIGPVTDELANSMFRYQPGPQAWHDSRPITPRMQFLISEISNNHYQGTWNKLYLQSQVLELLTLQCEQLEQTVAAPKRGFRLLPADIKKVELARDILLHDLQNPPSFTMLCKQVGLNEFKLKKGFKQVFHHTVFGYLKDHRLEIARSLLSAGELSVTEVAYETGYTTLQHFSNEFKKKFGVSPARIKQRI
ncbi:helix-turn-helix transcriptional regulator [Chitinophaga nivalis]|uniref:AraC family transcriptional regulator n=1 Tax=Chitinophaga nivalis TaxID=2991709 RepID=A0ABT3IJ40_9BACT|nr:AraC family transcriptional regulator [Chitinophaga nivalis]MCW3466333.1 AraC family transcriptional regulator [Chitinophaga nivalis]MCW3483976.1 AraC family transcriptional regulator [Chitinophaga nivalis]